MTIKHPQSILAVDAEQITRELGLVQGFNAVSYAHFIEVLRTALITRQRNHLDNVLTSKDDVVGYLQWYAGLHGIELNFPNLSLVPDFVYDGNRRYLQLLPYRIVIESHDGVRKIALYKRLETGGESRLHDAISCGYGGHPDFFDLVTEGQMILRDDDRELDPTDKQLSTVLPDVSLDESAEREFDEEVRIENNPENLPHAAPQFLGLILDRSDEVGQLHLAVVYGVQLPDGARAVPDEAELEAVESETPADALAKHTGLESWSKIVAKHLVQEWAE